MLRKKPNKPTNPAIYGKQLANGSVLSPKIFKESVKVHPYWYKQ